MPLSNLNKQIENRRAVDQLTRKSQLWAGFLIPSITFLIGFFRDNLHSVFSLLIPLSISLFLFVATMELADYSDLQWQLSVSESLYCLSAMVLFAGIAYYVAISVGITSLSLIFLIPMLFYGLIWFLSIRTLIFIYRR